MAKRWMATACLATLLVAGCGGDPGSETALWWAPIVNGEITEDYPAVIALILKDSLAGAGALCSGTIVNDEWMLTAAHCPLMAEDEGGFSADYSAIYVGPDFLDGDVTTLRFDEWYAHPDYNGIADDAAVFHLEEPSPVEGIPINRFQFDETFVDETCVFVGFGTNESGTVDGLKRQADIDVTGVFPTAFYYYDAVTMTDHGDSGGPALYDFGEGMRVTGITSWGVADYGVSTRVDDVAEWIDGYTGGDSPAWTDDDDDTAGDDDTDAGDDDTDAGDDDDDGEGDGCACAQAAGAPSGTAALAALALAGATLSGRRFRRRR